MKHIVISAVCTAIIFIYAFFSTFYINKFTDSCYSQLKNAEENGYTIQIVTDLKSIVSKNKFLLEFMTEKSRIEDMENLIIELENAVKYDDEQQIYLCENKLLYDIEQIKSSAESLL